MFNFPERTILNRKIPKKKFLENRSSSHRLKTLMTGQVQEILWHAKLSPESTNLPATPKVAEIAIFQLKLKSKDIHPDLLDYLDKALSNPVFFQVTNHEGKTRYTAAFKRPSEADSTEWTLGSRFETEWLTSSSHAPASASGSASTLPIALDLEHLYRALFSQLLPLAARTGESLEELVTRNKSHQILARKVSALQNKLHKERQYKKQIILNQELNQLKAELATLD